MSNISPVQFGPRICPGCGYDYNAAEDVGSRGCPTCGRTLPYQPKLVRQGHGYDIHIKDSYKGPTTRGEWGHVSKHEGHWSATMYTHDVKDSPSVKGHRTRDEAVDAVMRAAGWRGKMKGDVGYAARYGLDEYADWSGR